MSGTIRRLLVANRAEIAARVFRTCRDLGIETVAVFSEADAGLPYVREATVGVPLPGSHAMDTYLRADLLVDAALRSGADAIHPGYGFLSENAGFATAVLAAGLTWVGPDPAAIEAMGSKVRAKQLVCAAGVPVLEVSGTPGPGDLPLLVKASAGGGGRGMRVVRRLDELEGELAAARAEAASAFGDDTVFLEPYVERARHVEVQVVGDSLGTVEVYGERDCSVQRRHQKVVEESPAPGLSDATRSALHAAARAAAEAVGYVGAGTVEFLLDPATGRFFFLEMNTRLQVEHPVTEEVHGVDLVALQLAVAEGRPVPPAPAARGHALEVRLYAEDPAAGYAPQSGVLTRWEIPGSSGVRVDAGVESGSVVSTFYDAMLAKVVAHAPTRDEAARTLAGVLARARIHGLATNRDQLVSILRAPDFLAGDVTTDYLDQHPPATPEPSGDHAVAATVALAERDRLSRPVQAGVPVAWRNVVSQPQVTRMRRAGATPAASGSDAAVDDVVAVEWHGGRGGYLLDGLRVRAAGPDRVLLERDGVVTPYDVAVDGDRVDVDAPGGHAAYVVVPRFSDPEEAAATGSLLAPMPGTVVGVAVAPGDPVEPGQTVVVVEAMKMQHTVAAPYAGTVAELAVRLGDQVAAGELLAVVSADQHREEGSPPGAGARATAGSGPAADPEPTADQEEP